MRKVAQTERVRLAPDEAIVPLDLVVVGGAGHVGLPLALAFAETGMRVGIYDLASDKLASLASGQMPFKESGAPELLGRT